MTAAVAWSVRLCAAAAAAAFFKMTVPDLQKYGLFSLVRIVLLLFMLHALLPAAFETAQAIGSLTVEPTARYDENDAYTAAVADELGKALKENLLRDGINVNDVRIEFSVDGDEILIRSIAIAFSDGEAHTAICESLSKKWEIPVRDVTEGKDAS